MSLKQVILKKFSYINNKYQTLYYGSKEKLKFCFENNLSGIDRIARWTSS